MITTNAVGKVLKNKDLWSSKIVLQGANLNIYADDGTTLVARVSSGGNLEILGGIGQL